jgi:hypothetical protein
MWLIADYEAVALFSLKPSAATASGGKTLLVPTPYAIKMALLDAACRVLGVSEAEALWPEIRDLHVALRPPDRTVVTNLFQKVLRPRRSAAEEGAPDAGPFQRTIGYREYAQLVGPLRVAVGWPEDERREWIAALLLNVSYLGKRGGFVQLLEPPAFADALPPDFVEVTRDQAQFAFNGTLQVLDDCASGLTFAQASIYSRERITLGKERLTRPIVLPCRLARSSKSFTLYERLP